MNLATITLFCRERFRLDAWRHYVDEYQDGIALHVIVNNGDPADTELLKERFPDSMVLESPTSNMMASYNLALKEILKHPEIDAIGQIVNDIRIEDGGIRKLYDILFGQVDCFAVSPVLLEKDSDVIDCFGCSVNRKTFQFVHLDAGASLAEVPIETKQVDALPAGVFIAKRTFYERYGIQDEALNMYADEIDMALRVKKVGLRMMASSEIRAWHQHVNASGRPQRNARASYLMGRNAVYLAGKHFSSWRRLVVFLYHVYRGIDEFRSALFHGKRDGSYAFGQAIICGAWDGLFYRAQS